MNTNLIELASAKGDELNDVHALLQACREAMERDGIFQWDTSYPSLSIVEEDYEQSRLYVCRMDGIVVGAVSLYEDEPGEYKSLQWNSARGEASVVHRLGVRPDYQSKGIAKRLMGYAEDLARQAGKKAIKLDTYSENEKAAAFYTRLGYTVTGQVHFAKRVKGYWCFEKLV
ncbi:GNAT family N-acetyltransferase [Paenibacillus sp. GCM10023252]|uniref:GNAT family N-acetyltransferase n=1 Tax=Paenibacillus sp. GCM10023252 TaxID=3252649 RepID=UPI00361135D4